MNRDRHLLIEQLDALSHKGEYEDTVEFDREDRELIREAIRQLIELSKGDVS